MTRLLPRCAPALFVGAMVSFLAPPAGAQDDSAEPAAPTVLDAETETQVRRMATWLEGLPSFHLVVDDTIDDVQPDGEKLQFAHRREVTVARPDRFVAVTRGDVNNRTAWKNASAFTLYDRDTNAYLRLDAPGPIDDLLTRLASEFGSITPAADLLYSNVYETFTAPALAGRSLGEHRVGAELCHHLAFTGETVDWQLWIDVDDPPMLRKVVLTYKLELGEPQYEALIEIQPAASVPSAAFDPQVPEGAALVTAEDIMRPGEAGQREDPSPDADADR